MKILLRNLLVVSFVVMTAACQVQENGESYSLRSEREVAEALDKMGVSKGEVVNNLFNFTVNGFNAINDLNLIVKAGVDDHYLLTLTAPCFNLRYAFSVALVTRSSTVRQFDTVVVNSLHNTAERCSIRQIYQLVDKPE